MARIRSLHPGQWTDEDFVCCSPFARLLALGLRNEADDQGVFEWKPVTIKMRLLPADNEDVAALLDELDRADLVRCFEIGGKKFGAIRNFGRFQSPKKPTNRYEVPNELRGYLGLKQESSEPGPPNHPSGTELTNVIDHSSSEPKAPIPRQSTEPAPPSNGESSEPVRNQSGKVDLEGKGVGKGREKETNTQPPRSSSPNSAPGDLAEFFVSERSRMYPGDSRLPAPLLTIVSEATAWLEQGIPPDVMRQQIVDGVASYAKNGKSPPRSLAAFGNSLQDAAAKAETKGSKDAAYLERLGKRSAGAEA